MYIDIEELNKISKESLISDGMSSFECAIKRILDIIVAISCLIIFSPLFLFCCIVIKKEDGGSIFYKQERIGRFGKPFYIYKFRSMIVNAEEADPQLYKKDIDPRLTKIGKTLRVHHLDELPQLWNVLRGDMSFVGPRPERKFFIDQISAKDSRYHYLYQIRPGVTSYATLYNGYTDTIDKMVKRLHFDLYYLKHRSFLTDIKILYLTFYKIISGIKF
mgnify:CR=1 FL=1|jgi:bacterial sugar transferase